MCWRIFFLRILIFLRKATLTAILTRRSLFRRKGKPKELLAELEVNMINQALEAQGGVVARAADMLGMRRTTLVEKMRKYNMQR